MSQPTYDVALSFAGTDRALVRAVAAELQERGVACFYDEMRRVDLWGRDLYDALDSIYRNGARFVVMFVSQAYVDSIWTNHERQAAQATALRSTEPYILPVRLDDAEVPGLSPNVAFLDGTARDPAELAGFIVEKVELDRATAPPPDTEPGWEWLLLAEALKDGYAALGSQLADYRLGIAAPSGEHVSVDTAPDDLDARRDELGRLVTNINRVLTQENMEWAVGAPGEPGDADHIRQYAAAITSTFAYMLDWAARARGVACPPEYHDAYDRLALFVERPLQQLKEFIDEYDRRICAIVDAVRTERPLPEEGLIQIVLQIDLEHEKVEAYNAALDQARRHYRSTGF